jgi:hypothetical protein
MSDSVGPSQAPGSESDESLRADVLKLLKSEGKFDEFRRDCLANIDTKVC